MQEYEAPVLEVIGSMQDLTLETRQGSRLDAGFPAGTNLQDLTVS